MRLSGVGWKATPASALPRPDEGRAARRPNATYWFDIKSLVPQPIAPKQRDLTLRALSLLRRVSAATHEWQRSGILHGFTINQALVLHHLVKHGDASPSMLADWMQVTRGSVTPTIQHLEGLGLVKRRTDAKDGRRQWLTATPKARAVTDDVERQVLRPALSVFSRWPTDDLERFCRGLDHILASHPFGGRP